MAYLSKYGVARKIRIPIVKRGVVDHAVGADWTPAAGDVKIAKDGGAAANVTNLPTAIAMGNSTVWEFSLTATEMQAAQINVTVGDSATKAVEDDGFDIETYGNASAQHAVDLSDTVRAGLTALPNAVSGTAGALPTTGTGANQINVAGGRADANVIYEGGTLRKPRYQGTAQGGGAASVILANGTSALQCEPGDVLEITAGTGTGQSNIVLSLTGAGTSTPVATMMFPWPFAVPDGTSGYELTKLGSGIPATISDLTVDGSPIARESTLGTPAGASIAADIAGVITAILTKLGTPAGASVSADIANAYSRLGIPVGASMSADIAAVKTDTSTLATNYTGTRAGRLDHLDVDISSRLAPTTAGRTLDVSATGEGGVDWANVGGQATVVNLTNTAIASGGGGGTDLTPVLTAVASVQADTTTLTGRLSSARATKLDNLDTTVSSRLAPTVAARTLDVTATGEAGIDWANVGSPTAAVALSATTIKTATDLGTTLGTPVGASVSADIAGVQTKLGSPVGASVSADVAAVQTKLGSPAGVSVSADVAAVKADTGTLTSRLTGTRASNLDNLDATITSRLAPTVPGRTLDVSAGGEAGLDLANVGSPTTVVNLSGVTIKTASDLGTTLGSPAGASVSADVAALSGKIGTPAGASVSADVAAVKTDTGSVSGKMGTPAVSVSADIAAVQTKLGTPAGASVSADVAAVRSDTTKIGNPAGASVSADIAAVKTDTTKLGTPAGASVSADIAAVQTKLGTPAGASVSSDVAAVKTDTGAIKSKTDNLTASPADETLIINATNAIMARLGVPAGASAAADIAAIKAVLPAALIGGRMDSDVGNMRSAVITAAAIADAAFTAAKAAAGFIGAAQLGSDAANEIRDAIFAQIIEGSVTFIQSTRAQGRAMLAKVSGMDSNSPHFRDLADTKDSIVASTDGFGNRHSVAVDYT